MSLKEYVNKKPRLKSKRLLLRALMPEDIPALREWMSEPAIYRYWGKNPGKSDKNPELLFEKEPKPEKSFHWGIFHPGDGKVIGEMWVYLIENNRMAKVAFRLNPQYQGHGYATEALCAVVDFCFTKTELQRLWSDVDIRNEASCHVLEKSGFSQEGLIRQGKMVSSWCDYYIYGILKSDRNDK